jgi:hypothetical protein
MSGLDPGSWELIDDLLRALPPPSFWDMIDERCRLVEKLVPEGCKYDVEFVPADNEEPDVDVDIVPASAVSPEAGASETPDVPQDSLMTVWYHAGQSYSTDARTPVLVSREQHNILQAFLDCEEALGTKALSKTGVSNVTTAIKKLIKKFGVAAIRRPQKRGDGYFIRVRTLKPS